LRDFKLESSEVNLDKVNLLLEWNSTFFAFLLIKEGATEKLLQFIMPLQRILKQNLGFTKQKMYF
jgi:hypothetical protein